MSNNFAPIVVRASTLARLIDFTSSAGDTGFLTGVRIEPHDEGAIAVATNGKSLGTIFDKVGMCSRAITVQAEKRALKRILRGNTTDQHFAVVTQKPNGTDADLTIVVADNANQALERRPIEDMKVKTIGEFQKNWRAAFGKQLGQAHTMDKALLKTAIRALDAGSKEVTFRPNERGAVIVRSDDDDFAGVIAPVTNPKSHEIPDWLR